MALAKGFGGAVVSADSYSKLTMRNTRNNVRNK